MAKEEIKKPPVKKKTINKPNKKTQAKKTTKKQQIATKTKAEKKIAEETTKETKKEQKPVKEEIKKTEIKEKKIKKIKKKPVLNEEIKQQLEKRKEIKKRTPKFLREEWFRYKRIPKNWRRPDGISSKMRKNLTYRPNKVRIGFRGPKQTRGLHSSGFQEKTIFNVKDLDTLNPKTQAARIGGSVGTKKRIEIEKKAEKLDIRILNI
jgi:large subunit ribosomal protein L32e